MSEGRLIGDAYIAVLAQTSDFRAGAEKGVREGVAGINPKIPVGADMLPFLAEVQAAKDAIESRGNVDLTFAGNVVPMRRSIGDVQGMVDGLRNKMRDIPVSWDDSKAIASLFDMNSGLNGMDKQLKKLARDASREGEDIAKAFVPQKLLQGFYQLDQVVKDFETRFLHITPDMNIGDVVAKAASLRALVGNLGEQLKTLKLDPDDLEGRAKLLGFQNQVMALKRQLHNMPMDADTGPIEQKLLAMTAQARAFQEALNTPSGNVTITDPVARASAASQFSATDSQLLKLTSDVRAGQDAFAKMGKEAPHELALISAALTDVDARMTALTSNSEVLTTGSLSKVNALAGDVRQLSAAFGQVDMSAVKTAAATTQAARGFGLFGGAIAAIQNTHIPLFATQMTVAGKDAGLFARGLTILGSNMFTTASGFHILMESVIELAAVWGPALIGLTAFGIAAYPIAKNIYSQFKNMQTVVGATGQSLQSSAKLLNANGSVSNFTSMKADISGVQDAIKPEVLQLWGDFLTLKGSSHFTSVMHSIGGVLDDFGARLVLDLNSKTTQTFLQNAAKDIAGLGDGFVQVGRIIGTVMQAVPGFAHGLLTIGDAALTMVADIVQPGEKVLAYFLKLHGYVFYLGLASTIMLTFGRAAVTAFGQVAAGEAVAVNGGKLAAWGAAVGTAGANMAMAGKAAIIFAADLFGLTTAVAQEEAAFVLMNGVLVALPWIAAAAAATALGFVIYKSFNQGASEADKFGASMQKLVTSSNVADIQTSIASAVKQTTAQLKAQTVVTNQLSHAYNMANKESAGRGTGFLGGQLTAASNQSKAYAQQLVNLSGQSATAAIRMNGLGKAYGNTNAVLELFTLAGVKQGDIASANAGRWALDVQKLNATSAAYGFVGQQAGQLGNQLDTLNIATGTNAQAVQTLVSAEGSWLTMITSGDSAFTTFEQQQSQLASTLKDGSKSAATFTVRVGKLTEKYTATGIAMTGTSQAALAARQAFDSQITAAGTLYGSLQTLAAASGNTKSAQLELGKAGKDMVGQLLQVAGGSKEATTEVYALAQLVGYTGKDSFQALAKWVGKTKNSMSDLNTEQGLLTASSATLSQAAKNLGNALSADVTQSQAAAILTASKFNGIQNTLINTLIKTKGHLTDTAGALAGQYYQALVAAGIGTDQATQMTDALLQDMKVAPDEISAVNAQLQIMGTDAGILAGQLTNLTQKDWLIKVKVTGLQGITPGIPAGVAAPGGSPAAPAPTGGNVARGRAAGAYIVRGSGPSGRDSVHAMLAPGELVIPTSHSAQFTASAKRAGVPGLASGGMVGSSSPFTSASQSLSYLLNGSLFGYSGTALDPLLNPAEAAVTGPQTQPMTQGQGMNVLQLLQQLVRLTQANPQALAQALNSPAGSGARKAWGGI